MASDISTSYIVPLRLMDFSKKLFKEEKHHANINLKYERTGLDARIDDYQIATHVLDEEIEGIIPIKGKDNGVKKDTRIQIGLSERFEWRGDPLWKPVGSETDYAATMFNSFNGETAAWVRWNITEEGHNFASRVRLNWSGEHRGETTFGESKHSKIFFNVSTEFLATIPVHKEKLWLQPIVGVGNIVNMGRVNSFKTNELGINGNVGLGMRFPKLDLNLAGLVTVAPGYDEKGKVRVGPTFYLDKFFRFGKADETGFKDKYVRLGLNFNSYNLGMGMDVEIRPSGFISFLINGGAMFSGGFSGGNVSGGVNFNLGKIGGRKRRVQEVNNQPPVKQSYTKDNAGQQNQTDNTKPTVKLVDPDVKSNLEEDNNPAPNNPDPNKEVIIE